MLRAPGGTPVRLRRCARRENGWRDIWQLLLIKGFALHGPSTWRGEQAARRRYASVGSSVCAFHGEASPPPRR
jgi:hypothetical protein